MDMEHLMEAAAGRHLLQGEAVVAEDGGEHALVV